MSRALWYLRLAQIRWRKMSAEERQRLGGWPNDPGWDGEFGDAWVQLFMFL